MSAQPNAIEPEQDKVHGVGIKTMDSAHLDAQAAAFRSRGMSYRMVAHRMQCSVATAHDRVQRALAAVPVEAVEALREVERARLDEMYRVAWRELHRDHPLVQGGKVVMVIGEDGVQVPLIDQGGKLAALDRLLRVAERRARLEGLDLPTRVEAKLTIEQVTPLDAEIDDLIRVMRDRDDAPRS